MQKFIDAMTQLWPLTNVNVINTLQAKGARHVIHVSTNEGHWVLKVLDPERTEEEARAYTDVLQFLSKLQTKIAPAILPQTDGRLYGRCDDRFMYVMEYIEGTQANETPEDEFALGQLTAELHAVEGYEVASTLDFQHTLRNMITRFKDRPYYEEYLRVLQNIPDFTIHRQSLMHTDIGPHNCLKQRDGNLILVDFDDAGLGATYIDVGYPLICQFVRFHDETLRFDAQNAVAFYSGYQRKRRLTDEEIELTFQGGVFMQAMYMDAYGEAAVDKMWAILQYALEHRDVLKQAIRNEV